MVWQPNGVCEQNIENSVTARIPILTLSTEAAVSISIPIDKSGAEAAVSDEVLLTHVAGGDQQALGCLFERYGRLLRSVAARILGDCSEAEDLVQDLFLFIHRKIRDL